MLKPLKTMRYIRSFEGSENPFAKYRQLSETEREAKIHAFSERDNKKTQGRSQQLIAQFMAHALEIAELRNQHSSARPLKLTSHRNAIREYSGNDAINLSVWMRQLEAADSSAFEWTQKPNREWTNHLKTTLSQGYQTIARKFRIDQHLQMHLHSLTNSDDISAKENKLTDWIKWRGETMNTSTGAYMLLEQLPKMTDNVWDTEIGRYLTARNLTNPTEAKEATETLNWFRNKVIEREASFQQSTTGT